MPRGVVAHISMVVKDIDRAVEKWGTLLQVLDPEAVKRPPVYMEGTPGGVHSICATFVNPGGCEIQFMSPQNDAARQAFGCDKFGDEFVHHICFITPDPNAAGKELREKGLRTTGFSFDDDTEVTVSAEGLKNTEWGEWLMVPMEDGKVLVEVVPPYKPEPGGEPIGGRESGKWVPNESWDPDARVG